MALGPLSPWSLRLSIVQLQRLQRIAAEHTPQKNAIQTILHYAKQLILTVPLQLQNLVILLQSYLLNLLPPSYKNQNTYQSLLIQYVDQLLIPSASQKTIVHTPRKQHRSLPIYVVTILEYLYLIKNYVTYTFFEF